MKGGMTQRISKLHINGKTGELENIPVLNIIVVLHCSEQHFVDPYGIFYVALCFCVCVSPQIVLLCGGSSSSVGLLVRMLQGFIVEAKTIGIRVLEGLSIEVLVILWTLS